MRLIYIDETEPNNIITDDYSNNSHLEYVNDEETSNNNNSMETFNVNVNKMKCISSNNVFNIHHNNSNPNSPNTMINIYNNGNDNNNDDAFSDDESTLRKGINNNLQL